MNALEKMIQDHKAWDKTVTDLHKKEPALKVSVGNVEAYVNHNDGKLCIYVEDKGNGYHVNIPANCIRKLGLFMVSITEPAEKPAQNPDAQTSTDDVWTCEADAKAMPKPESDRNFPDDIPY